MSVENKALQFTGSNGGMFCVFPGELISAEPYGDNGGSMVEFQFAPHLRAIACVTASVHHIVEVERRLGRPLGFGGKPWRRGRP